MNDITFIINNLFLDNREIISSYENSKNVYYLYMGLSKSDILLPEQTKHLIDYGILELYSGSFDGDYSYILTDKVNIKRIITYLEDINYNYINRKDFLPAIRSLKLSKLNI